MIDLGTARVKDVLTSLGNPELRIANRVVHVTGTNGKGSTVEMIATGLAGCGYRVGTFTSPFVVHERDSIRVFDSMGSDSIRNAATCTGLRSKQSRGADSPTTRPLAHTL